MENTEPIEKLTSISEQLRDHLVDINWEDRKFMVALTIFDTLVKSTELSDTKCAAFTGILAESAINMANIFIDKYRNNGK